ncbi:MAG: hypothetical protein DMF98_16785 [Acidobacteria bacterium]|nr:MAG: hypothetical protein DMF98_16785 [Acidobacteriota bacterium]
MGRRPTGWPRRRRPTSTRYSGRDRVSQIAVKESTPALSQIFEPIRADLEKVDREFGRHIESQVDLIPKIGRYIQTSGGKRVRPAVLLMAARLGGYQGDRSVLYAAVVEFIHTATLVHDDIIDDSDLRRGLSVHQVDGDGPDARHARDRPRAVRRDAEDDRGRAVSAHQEWRCVHQRGRTLRHHPAQDRVPFRWVRADWRHARQRRRRA